MKISRLLRKALDKIGEIKGASQNRRFGNSVVAHLFFVTKTRLIIKYILKSLSQKASNKYGK